VTVVLNIDQSIEKVNHNGMNWKKQIQVNALSRMCLWHMIRGECPSTVFAMQWRLAFSSLSISLSRERERERECVVHSLLYNKEREHQPSLSLSLSGTDYSLSLEWECVGALTVQRGERADFVIINRRSLSLFLSTHCSTERRESRVCVVINRRSLSLLYWLLSLCRERVHGCTVHSL
jgi:hypothetical protein